MAENQPALSSALSVWPPHKPDLTFHHLAIISGFLLWLGNTIIVAHNAAVRVGLIKNRVSRMRSFRNGFGFSLSSSGPQPQYLHLACFVLRATGPKQEKKSIYDCIPTENKPKHYTTTLHSCGRSTGSSDKHKRSNAIQTLRNPGGSTSRGEKQNLNKEERD